MATKKKRRSRRKRASYSQRGKNIKPLDKLNRLTNKYVRGYLKNTTFKERRSKYGKTVRRDKATTPHPHSSRRNSLHPNKIRIKDRHPRNEIKLAARDSFISTRFEKNVEDSYRRSVCKSRKERRAVLFSSRKAGKGKSGPKERIITEKSKVRC